jgi:hypothetical protein
LVTKLSLQEKRAAQMKDITDKGHQPDPVDRDDDLHGDEDPEVDPDDDGVVSAPLDGKLPESEDNPDELIQVKVNGDVVEMTREEIIAHAQKSLAAEDIVGEAKGLRDEARGYLCQRDL